MSASSETSTAPAPGPSTPGFGWRVAISIVSVFGWLSFVLLYFAFWADGFTGVQSGVLILVSLLVFIAVNGAAWASWGTRYARAHHA